jgi:predicted nucleotidyltransferase
MGGLFMEKNAYKRDDMVSAMVEKLRQADFVHAVWEAGAASFDRVDEWSDIDLYVICDDDRIENVITLIEQTLHNMGQVDLKFRVPEPTWHGNSQVFWRLKESSPFLFVDAAIIKKSSKEKFLQYSIHGKPLVHFDKTGVIKDDPVDIERYLQEMKTRFEAHKTTFEMFQVLVLKELNRGNAMEALSYYLSYILRPLVEVLRMKYSPWHYRFFTTYVYYEMPAEIVERIHRMYFVNDEKTLKKCREEAETWFWDVVKTMDWDEVKKRLVSPE